MGKRYMIGFGGNPRSQISVASGSGERSFLADCTTANIPADGKPGYMGGALLMVTDASTGISATYQNTGTISSCAFRPIPVSSGLTDTTALAASIAEINRVAQASTRIVATTGTSISVTAASHGERDLVLNSTHTVTCTLPAASGTGNRYSVLVGVTGTDGSKIVTVANTTDVIAGGSLAVNTQSTTIGFQTTNATTVTFNNTTTGGKIGSRIELVDVAAGSWLARVSAITSGNPATPFS